MKEHEKYLEEEEQVEKIPVVEVLGEQENTELVTVFPLYYTDKLSKHSIDHKE